MFSIIFCQRERERKTTNFIFLSIALRGKDLNVPKFFDE